MNSNDDGDLRIDEDFFEVPAGSTLFVCPLCHAVILNRTMHKMSHQRLALVTSDTVPST